MKKVVLALQILALLAADSFTASSNMDIDYSHNVEGTGTVFTDFRMGSEENTEATGRVRGTGEVMNRYLFQSNASENITIKDQFLLTSPSAASEIIISDYPGMVKSLGFRMLGAAWADQIDILQSQESKNQTRP
jgi:hypothetical protein